MSRSKGVRKNHPQEPSKYSAFGIPTVRIPHFPVPKELFTATKNNLKPKQGMSERTLKFIHFLEKALNNDQFETKESNHLQVLKIMLYLEEIQNSLDMRRYDQKVQIIRKQSPIEFFKISIKGLSEEGPSVRPDDRVEVRDTTNYKSVFCLVVINVMDDHIIVKSGNKKFSKNYSPEKFYNIRFKFQNWTLRCSHYALTLIDMFHLTPILFPIQRTGIKNPSDSKIWFNQAIKNNPEQKKAVQSICGKSSKPSPYILYGPPGTGKTATLVEAICQVYHNDSSEKILICTPSNAAADVITKRLLQYLPDIDIYRMYSLSKEGSRIDKAIVNCSNLVEGQIMMLPKEVVKEKRIVICTLCACIRLLFMEFSEKHFAYVFIDEAGQAVEPDAMIPFTLLSSTKDGRIGKLHSQVILAGDPQQLGPGIRSRFAEPILGKSMLERLMKFEPYTKDARGKYNPLYITKLLQNYRNHPKIIQVSNELFYESELKACSSNDVKKAEDWSQLPKSKFPVMFHGVEGMERKSTTSPSVYNNQEIKIVMNYVRNLLGRKLKNNVVTQKYIGIITPFAEQRKRIMRELGFRKYNDIEVGTVEYFQGQEKEIIILSTVRNKVFNHGDKDHLGFLSSEKRFNVALTRAKALLIVVGNPTVLQIDKHWNYFLNFCVRNDAYKGMDFKLTKICDAFESKQKVASSGSCTSTKVLDPGTLNLIKIDDGVDKGSDSSSENENQDPNASANKSQIKHNTIQPPKLLKARSINQCIAI